MPGKWLSGPLETSDRREWVATDAGLSYAHRGGLVKSLAGRGWLVLEQDGNAAWLDDQSELHSLESKKVLGKARALSSFSSVITSVTSDSSGCLWIGTRGEGLLRVSGIGENATVRRYTRNDGLSSDFVQSIFEDTEQNIWVGTQNGLNRLRRDRVLSLTQESGLISDTVTSIVAGGDGAVWLGTADGLERLREISEAAAIKLDMPPRALERYLADNIHFGLEPEYLAGLNLYYEKAAAFGLIPRHRPLEFAAAQSASASSSTARYGA